MQTATTELWIYRRHKAETMKTSLFCNKSERSPVYFKIVYDLYTTKKKANNFFPFRFVILFSSSLFSQLLLLQWRFFRCLYKSTSETFESVYEFTRMTQSTVGFASKYTRSRSSCLHIILLCACAPCFFCVYRAKVNERKPWTNTKTAEIGRNAKAEEEKKHSNLFKQKQNVLLREMLQIERHNRRKNRHSEKQIKKCLERDVLRGWINSSRICFCPPHQLHWLATLS